MKSTVPDNAPNAAPPFRCPKCGSTDIAEIVYNPSTLTDDLLARIRARKAVIRREAQTATAARYHCNYCQYEW